VIVTNQHEGEGKVIYHLIAGNAVYNPDGSLDCRVNTNQFNNQRFERNVSDAVANASKKVLEGNDSGLEVSRKDKEVFIYVEISGEEATYLSFSLWRLGEMPSVGDIEKISLSELMETAHIEPGEHEIDCDVSSQKSAIRDSVVTTIKAQFRPAIDENATPLVEYAHTA